MVSRENVSLLVCGSRGWSDSDSVTAWIEAFTEAYSVHLFDGCATGADSFACGYVGKIEHHEHQPAMWEIYGNRAGPVRNAILRDGMVYNRDELGHGCFVLAFKEDYGTGKGTEHMVRIVSAVGIKGLVIRSAGGSPVLPDRSVLWPKSKEPPTLF